MKKQLYIYVGTDYPINSPSHPYSCAVAAKNYIDRIVSLPESKFELRMNSDVGIKLIEHYAKNKDIVTKYYINGKKATFKQVLKDLSRGEEYVNKIINQLEKQV